MIVMVRVKIWGKMCAYESPSKDRDTKIEIQRCFSGFSECHY